MADEIYKTLVELNKIFQSPLNIYAIWFIHKGTPKIPIVVAVPANSLLQKEMERILATNLHKQELKNFRLLHNNDHEVATLQMSE